MITFYFEPEIEVNLIVTTKCYRLVPTNFMQSLPGQWMSVYFLFKCPSDKAFPVTNDKSNILLYVV